MFPRIEGVEFEENAERLKVTLPVKRSWVFLGLYTVLLLTAVAMLLGGLVYMIQIARSGERFAFVFVVMLLFLLLIMYRFTRFLWNQWQYYVTNREILFINPEEMIIRRPVSLWGITNVYDMAHVRALAYDVNREGLSFDYGSQPVIWAHGLPQTILEPLASYINGRFFPYADDEDE